MKEENFKTSINYEESEKFAIQQSTINVKNRQRSINIIKADQKFEDIKELNSKRKHYYFK